MKVVEIVVLIIACALVCVASVVYWSRSKRIARWYDEDSVMILAVHLTEWVLLTTMGYVALFGTCAILGVKP